MICSSHSLVAKAVHKCVLDNLGFNLTLTDVKFGCMKPDFFPKLIALPHYKEKSFKAIAQMIWELQNAKPTGLKEIRNFSMELGVVLHYISDYFCYAHNNKVLDRMPSHLFYEISLDIELRKYLSNALSDLHIDMNEEDHRNLNISIVEYIEGKHKQYMEDCHSLRNDVTYGMQACYITAISIVTAMMVNNMKEAA